MHYLQENFYTEPMSYKELESLRTGLFDLWTKGYVQGNPAAQRLHMITVIRMKVMILTVYDQETLWRERSLATLILRENQSANASVEYLTLEQKKYVFEAIPKGHTTGLEVYDINVTDKLLVLLEDLLLYAANESRALLDQVEAFLMKLPLNASNMKKIMDLIAKVEKKLKDAAAAAEAAKPVAGASGAAQATKSTSTKVVSETTVTQEQQEKRELATWFAILVALILALILLVAGMIAVLRSGLESSQRSYYGY